MQASLGHDWQRHADFSHPYDREAVVWWLLQCDCFAREQDMKQLCKSKSDYSVLERPAGHPEVALFFGAHSHGETAKNLPHHAQPRRDS